MMQKIIHILYYLPLPSPPPYSLPLPSLSLSLLSLPPFSLPLYSLSPLLGFTSITCQRASIKAIKTACYFLIKSEDSQVALYLGSIIKKEIPTDGVKLLTLKMHAQNDVPLFRINYLDFVSRGQQIVGE